MKKKNEKTTRSKTITGSKDFAKSPKKGQKISEKFTAHQGKLKLQPVHYDSKSVKNTRRLLNVSQSLFAEFLGVSIKTVHAWEYGANVPNPMACRFLDEIQCNPEYWKKRLKQSVELKA